MADREGDPTKQPLECINQVIPFGPDNPREKWDNPNAQGRYVGCPHLKETGGDFETERYSCEVCGKRYTLYYDEMR